MVLIGIGFTAFGIVIASPMEDINGFQRIMNFVIFPIFGVSEALFPISSLLWWLVPITMLDPLPGGRNPLRAHRTLADQSICQLCGHRGFYGRDDRNWRLSVQEDRSICEETGFPFPLVITLS